MNILLSVVLLFAIAMGSVIIVITIGRPIVDATVRTTDIQSSEDDLKFVDNYVRTTAREGKDSMRIFRFGGPKQFEVLPNEDVIQFSAESTLQIFDYLTRSVSGNYIYISGADVECREEDGSGDGLPDYIMENSRVKVVLRKISAGTVNISMIIMQMTEKVNNRTAYFGGSEIRIDDSVESTYGVGSTFLSRTGKNLPACQLQAVVDGTYHYDTFYKLYAGADFLVVEVRNIS